MPRYSEDHAFAALRRSLNTYYGSDKRTAAIGTFYARFLKPGDLGFDIGAHVGDRIGSFRRLGRVCKGIGKFRLYSHLLGYETL